MIRILRFIVGVLDTNCYLVYDANTRDAIIIDPGGEVDELIEWIKRLELNVRAIIATHGHFDHILGVDDVKSIFKCKFYMHKDDVEISRISMEWIRFWGLEPRHVPQPDVLLSSDCSLSLGSLKVNILHTPGHSKGSICIYVPKASALFTGDTLFAGTVGRTDLPGGSERDLVMSIKKIFRLIPMDAYVYPGHGPETTLKFELRINPFVEDAIRGDPT